MRVLLTTEGTYPFFRGGVSTWVHDLVTGLPEHEFLIAAVVGNPHVADAFPVPDNCRVLQLPLWGTETLDEYVPRSRPRIGRRARDRAFTRQFLPAYEEVVGHLLAPRDPRDLGAAFECRIDQAHRLEPRQSRAVVVEMLRLCKRPSDPCEDEKNEAREPRTDTEPVGPVHRDQ